MNNSKIIARYKITYANEISQERDLISQSDYENIIKSTQLKISEFELLKQDKEAFELKCYLKELFGNEYFTDESPIFKSLNNNILSLPQTQGGNMYCKLEKIS